MDTKTTKKDEGQQQASKKEKQQVEKETKQQQDQEDKQKGLMLTDDEKRKARELKNKQKAEAKLKAKQKKQNKQQDDGGNQPENKNNQKQDKKGEKQANEQQQQKKADAAVQKQQENKDKSAQKKGNQQPSDNQHAQNKQQKTNQQTHSKQIEEKPQSKQPKVEAAKQIPQAEKLQKSERQKKIELLIQKAQNRAFENSSLILHGQFSTNTFDEQAVQDINPSAIAHYLYNNLEVDIGHSGKAENRIYADMHPAVHDTGVKLLTNQLQSTNQKTVAVLLTLSEVIRQFQATQTDFHLELLSLLGDKIVPFLEQCGRFSSGTEYAIKHVRTQIGNMRQDCKTLDDLKEQILEIIDTFIKVRVLYAQDTLINNGLNIISEHIEENILIYGNCESQTIEELLKKAFDTKQRRFKVIVIDSAPDYLGRGVVKRLTSHGIKCQYTLIQMINFLIRSVTKVFLPASYVLCNGSLVAPVGSGMIACLAHKYHIPVVAVSETYKFADRVNLDQINNNEQGNCSKFFDNFLLKSGKNANHLQSAQIQSEKKAKSAVSPVQLLNLKYDLTSQKYMSMIVCEIGNIPPHSVPVVIREIMNDKDDDEEDDQIEAETSSGSEEHGEFGVNQDDEVQERDDEQSSGDEEMYKQMNRRDQQKQKRIQERMKKMEQEKGQPQDKE